MKYKAYLYHLYCKVKDWIQREKISHTIRSRCARAWIVMDGMETPFVWSLSLYKFFWEHGYLFFFFMDLHVPTFFSFLFFQYLDLHVSIFYFDSPCLSSSFLTKTGERDQHILWSIYFMEWVDGTMLTSQRSIARGCMVCTWILIMQAWKEFSQGSQQFDKAQCKNKQHMCVWFSGSIIIWLWLHFDISKRSFTKGFPNFQINFPST